ncbi:hypothetical protein B0H10DRAFT_1937674 [Mycena sp. CBHHK59/15]|nr:hypothetical protein B0H10DRAFT_1937674 [Mycena sp. CBHHK59/15]
MSSDRRKPVCRAEKAMSDLEEREIKRELIMNMPRTAKHERYLNCYMLVRSPRERSPNNKPDDYYKQRMAELLMRKVRVDTLMRLRRSSSARSRGGLKVLSNGRIILKPAIQFRYCTRGVRAPPMRNKFRGHMALVRIKFCGATKAAEQCWTTLFGGF